MLTFIIPLRNPGTSKNWERCQELCRQTIHSALSQTDPDLRVVLACREFFPEPLQDPRLIVIQKDFPDPSPDWESQHVDKYKKIAAALVVARQFAPCHIMKLDADDLVSNKVAAFVKLQPSKNGYYFPQGYFWRDGARTFLLSRNFHHVCGSSNIIYAEPCQLPESDSDCSDFPLLKFGHNITLEGFASIGRPLEAIPFPAAVYRIGNGENITAHFSPSGSKPGARPNWKYYLGLLLEQRKRRFLSNNLRREFSIRL
jgi:hypothetical protein